MSLASGKLVDLVKNVFVPVSDEGFDASNSINFPGVENAEEAFVDLTMAESTVMSATIPTEEVIVRLVPIESTENADLLASFQPDVVIAKFQ